LVQRRSRISSIKPETETSWSSIFERGKIFVDQRRRCRKVVADFCLMPTTINTLDDNLFVLTTPVTFLVSNRPDLTERVFSRIAEARRVSVWPVRTGNEPSCF
jgi:hypothetical protein